MAEPADHFVMQDFQSYKGRPNQPVYGCVTCGATLEFTPDDPPTERQAATDAFFAEHPGTRFGNRHKPL